MTKLNLTALYRDATHHLPQQADARLTTDEWLALARGESLGDRQDAAVAGLAQSSMQAQVARIAMATQSWSEGLADALVPMRRQSALARMRAWFKAASLPPVLAACAMSLLAVGAWRVGSPAIGPITLPMSQLAAEDRLFSGEFDEAVAGIDEQDQLFDGDFDS